VAERKGVAHQAAQDDCGLGCLISYYRRKENCATATPGCWWHQRQRQKAPLHTGTVAGRQNSTIRRALGRVIRGKVLHRGGSLRLGRAGIHKAMRRKQASYRRLNFSLQEK
jgi:hypothetical protein